MNSNHFVNAKRYKYSKKPLSAGNYNFNNNTNNTKSIFSKLSEEMFDSIHCNNTNNYNSSRKYNFDSLVNEQFILQYSEKFNEKNNDIIKNFLKRTEQQMKKKKYKIFDSNRKNPKQTTINTNFNSNNKEKVKKFLNEQNLFLEKKKKNLQLMKKRLYTEEKENNTAVPIINQHSAAIVNKKRLQNNKKQNDKNTFAKKHALEISPSTYRRKGRSFVFPQHKIENKNIMISLNARKRSKSRSFSENLLIKPDNIIHSNNSSNNLLLQRFLKNYESEIKSMFHFTKEINFDLTFKEFSLLLHKLGFIVKNYEPKAELIMTQEYNKNNENEFEKEFQLLINAWKIITKINYNNNIYQQNINSYNVIVFLICILDLYKPNLIQTNLSFMQNNNKILSFTEKELNQVKSSFRLLFDNEMNFLFKQKISKSPPPLKINKKKKTKSFSLSPSSYQTKNRPSLIKTYDLFRKKREYKLEHLRTEKQNLELKECTFYPNNIKPKSKSVSTDVTNRLYSQRTIKQIKQQQEQDKTENVCSFSPKLSKMKIKMFNYNPIKDDKNVNEKIEQYEKARIDKKLNEYLLKQGIHSISHLKSFDEVVNDIAKQEPYLYFRFDNEYKGYKNTFEKFNKNVNGNNKLNKSREVKYVFEIKVEEQIKTLKIYKGDDISKNVDKFCNDNNLEPESKEQIIAAINDKIEQN